MSLKEWHEVPIGATGKYSTSLGEKVVKKLDENTMLISHVREDGAHDWDDPKRTTRFFVMYPRSVFMQVE